MKPPASALTGFIYSARLCLHVIATCLLASLPAKGAEYYVSQSGKDRAAGTVSDPFATIQEAADRMRAGDTCYIQAGRYRETVVLKQSGTSDKPIRFIAVDRNAVTLDGTEPVSGEWKRHEGSIWRVPFDRPQIEQVFVDGVMQHEARWPDMPFAERWDRKYWRAVGKRSEYGKVEAPGLGETGVNWTGGIAMLNIAHQFYTWSRDITSHQAGTDVFTYEQDLDGMDNFMRGQGTASAGWQDDYIYLFGRREALTMPTEWFHDPGENVLYYMPESKGAPAGVHYKRRDFGIMAKGVQHVELNGLQFMACAFNFADCDFISLTDCHLQYPNFRRRLVNSEKGKYKDTYPTALIAGNDNRVERCSILYSGGSALQIKGDRNLLQNCIIRDGCWSGSLRDSLVSIAGSDNIVRRNTISFSGSPLLQHREGPILVELNHFHNGGILSEDVAGVYTGGISARGAIIRYNWVHGVRTGHDRGLGIRGDDITRGYIVHHNVVWDCGMAGILMKGDDNQIFNNTVFGVSNGSPGDGTGWGRAGLLLLTRAEKEKPFREYHAMDPYLDAQNANSYIANNLVDDIDFRGPDLQSPRFQVNVQMRDKVHHYLVDPDQQDFRLKSSIKKSLPKAHKVPTEEGERSAANYIGACDPGKPAWIPGADWSL